MPRLAALVVSGSALLAGVVGSRAAVAQDQVPVSYAASYGEQETPRTLALAGATRALGNGTSAVFQNPADMVETRVYHLEAIGQFTPEAARHLYGGAIVDSMTSRLAGGLSFVGGFLDPSGLDRSFLDARLALAYPIAERFFVGLAGHYAKITQEGEYEPLQGSKASAGLSDGEGGRSSLVHTVTLDAGITVKATDAFHIAVLGQNLTFPDNAMLPTMIGGGLGFGTGDFSVEADGLVDFNSYEEASARIMVGGEVLVADHFPIRAGYRWDQGANIHSASLGLGFIAREFSVEASARRSISDPGTTMLAVSIAYFLESSSLGSSQLD